MPIAHSVGRTARNTLTDVLLVQYLLNMNRHRLPPPAPEPLDTDGRIGRETIQAIERFELEVMKLPESDGMLVPGDATIQALLDGLPPGPTREKLQVVMPRAKPARIEFCYQPLVKTMTRYGIDTPLRAAHFVAQIGHETASFLYLEEIADGSRYEGRSDLGNTQPGDGTRFKGRGLIQLTGRANYTAYSKDCGVDLLADPECVATDPFICVDVAGWYWNRRNINRLADRDDVKAVTKAVNGGYNGLDDRIDYLYRAKQVLGLK